MIDPVLLTEVVLPEPHPRAGAACAVFGFVIHHTTGPVLVDTGVGEGHQELDALFTSVHHPIEAALADVGVRLTEVRMVINSHLHFDHCGNNWLFPGVPLVVQETEYEAARQPGYTILEGIDFPGAEWTPIDGEVRILPGIRVLPTPGHTPGHQSVLVTRAEGIDVIAGQAVYDPDELDAEASIEPLDKEESEQTSTSARRIKATDPDRVFFSHDHRLWIPPRERA